VCMLPISVRTGKYWILLLFGIAERRNTCLPRNFGMMWEDDINMDNKNNFRACTVCQDHEQ